MNNLQQAFSEHPASVGETYWQHMGTALSFSACMALGSIICLVHAVLPFAFTRTGSQLIQRMHDRMVSCRHRNSATAASGPTALADTVPEAALAGAAPLRNEIKRAS